MSIPWIPKLAMSTPLTLLLGVVVALSGSGCSDGSILDQQLLDPVVHEFSITPEAIKSGEQVEIRWDVARAAELSIMFDGSALTPPMKGRDARAGRLMHRPPSSGLYRLVASRRDINGNRTALTTADASVRVDPIASRPVLVLSARPDTISAGEPVTITWSVINANSIRITENGARLDIDSTLFNGSIVRTPSRNTTYEVTAFGAQQSASRTAVVRVLQPPTVVSLSAIPSEIPRGGMATLSWQTIGANQIRIVADDEVFSVVGKDPAGDSISVSPKATTTFELTAIGPDGSDTDSVELTVRQPPDILEFTVDPAQVVAGETSTVRWVVHRAETVELWANDQPVDITNQGASGSIDLSVGDDTDFRLVATGPGGQTEELRTVTAIPPVEIRLFEAAPGVVRPGGRTVLRWETTGATTVDLFADDEPIEIGSERVVGTQEINVEETTVFLLRAQGPAGVVERTMTVVVNLEAEILAFEVYPEIILPGASATLTWQTIGAETVTIDAEPGEVVVPPATDAGLGSIDVTPAETTSYTLAAMGPVGTVTNTITLNVTPSVEIVRLEFSPPAVAPGTSTTLSWDTVGASAVTVSIDGDDTSVDPRGDVVLERVDDSARATLTAIGTTGEATQEATVDVITRAVVVSLSADTQGDETTVEWEAHGAITGLLVVRDDEGAEIESYPVDDEDLYRGATTFDQTAPGFTIELIVVGQDDVDVAELITL